jgi:hypothetical protein
VGVAFWKWCNNTGETTTTATSGPNESTVGQVRRTSSLRESSTRREALVSQESRMLCLGFYSVNSPFRLACAFTREFLVLKRVNPFWRGDLFQHLGGCLLLLRKKFESWSETSTKLNLNLYLEKRLQCKSSAAVVNLNLCENGTKHLLFLIKQILSSTFCFKSPIQCRNLRKVPKIWAWIVEKSGKCVCAKIRQNQFYTFQSPLCTSGKHIFKFLQLHCVIYLVSLRRACALLKSPLIPRVSVCLQQLIIN